MDCLVFVANTIRNIYIKKELMRVVFLIGIEKSFCACTLHKVNARSDE